MKALLQKSKWRWLLICVAVAFVSLIGGFLYGTANSPTGVRAQAGDPASTPTLTPQAPAPSPVASPTPLPAGAPTPQATPTRLPDSYSLPPDRTYTPPPLATPSSGDNAATDEAFRNCPTGIIARVPKPSGDGVWKCSGGRYGLPLSEEEIKDELAKEKRREEEETKLRAAAIAQSQKIEYLAFTGRDGMVKVPDDVQVQRYYRLVSCVVGRHCPQPPQYKLTRGQTSIMVDGFGYLYASQGDMSDPDLFSFLDGVVEDVRPKR